MGEPIFVACNSSSTRHVAKLTLTFLKSSLDELSTAQLRAADKSARGRCSPVKRLPPPPTGKLKLPVSTAALTEYEQQRDTDDAGS